jgi:hypothetical protein
MHAIAKEKFCDSCPVLKLCLEEALSFGDEEKGYVAGTTYEERQTMLSIRSLAQQVIDPSPIDYRDTVAELDLLFSALSGLGQSTALPAPKPLD